MTDREAYVALNAVIGRAKKGPLVVEAWDCPKCGVEAFIFHPMDESLPCGQCGHRVASKVWLYRFSAKAIADDR